MEQHHHLVCTDARWNAMAGHVPHVGGDYPIEARKGRASLVALQPTAQEVAA